MTGDALGRSTQEIQNAANTFGIFFNQAAPTRQAAADLSKQFAVLAQDLSSFYNVDPGEALQKLRSGLAGESEPLRDFGVFLTEATVKSKALELGLAKSEKAITEQNKVLARAVLIMEATTNAQGDVARTADGTANRIRAAAAAFQELQVAIGEKLIPAVRPLIEILTNLLNSFGAIPDSVQTAIVVLAGLAAGLGPLIFAVGTIKGSLVVLAGAFTATGGAAAAATPAVVGLRGALLGLQSSLVLLVAVIAIVGGGLALLAQRNKIVGETSKEFADGLEEANQEAQKATELSERLAKARGEERREILAQARAELELTKQKRESAQASLWQAQTELLRLEVFAKRSAGGIGQADPRFASQLPGAGAPKAIADTNADISTLRQTIAAQDQRIKSLQTTISSAQQPGVAAVGDPDKSDRKKPSGPTAAEIAAQFADEQRRLEVEALQARRDLATSAEERADIDLELLGLEREQRFAEIEASDYSEKQKAALKSQVEELLGTAAAQGEQGKIIVETNRGLIAQAVKREELADLEDRAADDLRDQFDLRRDHLQIDLELAETQEERKKISAEILRLEQEYRRNQLEMVLASKVSSDAEKERAAAILATLDLLDRREQQAGDRANRTEVERYLDSVNLSAEQVNEAIDGIKIDGLDALNDGLVDAITGVKSLGEVFKNIANQIIADLLRIAIQKAIVGPLANALFGGQGGGLSIDGARAQGGPVLAGGTYLVGENGPELFRPSSGGSIIPNHELGRAAGGSGVATIVPSKYFDVVVDGRIYEASPSIMQGSSQVTQRDLAHRQGRRIYG